MAQAILPPDDHSRTPQFDVVHARMLRFFGDLVAEQGVDPRRLVRRHGFDKRILETGAATYREIVVLLESAATELHCPDFGMRLALRQGATGMFGPAGEAMRTAATFGEAAEFVTTHAYAHSLAAGIWMRRSLRSRTVTLGHDILIDGIAGRAQITEQILLLGHLMALELTGTQVRVRRVLFRHQPVSPPATYRRYFGCEVRFGQTADAAVYRLDDLRCPIPASDPAAYRRAVVEIERRFPNHHAPVHARARGIITHFLGTALCTRERVAQELGLHPRTMDRRLNAERTSFQALKDEVRRDLLLYLLEQTTLDLARISEKLGYAEQSVMTRCCQKWFGLSPRGLRRMAARPGLSKSIKSGAAALRH